MTTYEKQFRVSYPQCDASGKLTLSNVMRRLQEAASEHLEAIDLGQKRLWDEGFVYLLNRVRLEINRRPEAMETVRLVTKPRGAKGVLSHRDVFFYDGQGHPLIQAQSAWVLVNPATHQVRRPSELGHAIPLESEAFDFGWCKERIRRAEGLVPVAEETIRYSQIDVNGHLNNAIYSDLVCDYLPVNLLQSRFLREYTIHFAGEIRLGEKMSVYCAQMDADTWYVAGDRSDGSACFTVIARFGD